MLKIDTTSLLGRRWPNLDAIWHSDAEYNADYLDVVAVETGRRISIWRTFVFPNRK